MHVFTLDSGARVHYTLVMIHSLTTPRERRYWNPADPEFKCAGCDAPAWTLEEHHKCIVCSKRFCADCLVAIGEEKYCPEHAKCSCGRLAIEACGECGEVLCDKCIGDSNFCRRCK